MWDTLIYLFIIIISNKYKINNWNWDRKKEGDNNKT